MTCVGRSAAYYAGAQWRSISSRGFDGEESSAYSTISIFENAVTTAERIGHGVTPNRHANRVRTVFVVDGSTMARLRRFGEPYR
jgi:hypothetical protein